MPKNILGKIKMSMISAEYFGESLRKLYDILAYHEQEYGSELPILRARISSSIEDLRKEYLATNPERTKNRDHVLDSYYNGRQPYSNMPVDISRNTSVCVTTYNHDDQWCVVEEIVPEGDSRKFSMLVYKPIPSIIITLDYIESLHRTHKHIIESGAEERCGDITVVDDNGNARILARH
jgi:hypothetical protein